MDTITNCPTFVDLAAILSTSASTAGSDPFGAEAQVLPVRAGSCEIFASAFSAGKGSFCESRGDCFVLVLEGELELAAGDRQVTVTQGTSAVITRGTEFSWRATAPVRLIGMRYADAPEGEGGIVAIDNQAAMSPSNPPLAELLIGETPSCRSANQFASLDDGCFKCGVWDSTPYHRRPMLFRHTELMHLLEGSVSFTDAAGRTATFAKGDTFIIEQGAQCSWDSDVKVAKIYGWYRPAD